jgi:site-specific DNA-methyltransferase (adenine-specific)
MFKNLVGTHKPDILDCISNLSSDEVFTPPAIVNQMLDTLPEEVWTNPDFKWLDPATKSGVFLREIAMRLMEGLKPAIPDEAERREHIFRNMLYGVAITELTGLIARRSLYYSKDASSSFSIIPFDDMQGNVHYSRGTHHYVNGKCWHCGSPTGQLDRGLHLENYAYQFIHDNSKTLKLPYALERFGVDMKFDVIIGNPPYQLQDAGDSSGASPIYNLFVDQAKKLNPRYISMIIPSRWFAGGKGLDGFRESMLKDNRISHIVDFHDAADCFPGVEIKGGVSYFLWDQKYSGDCEITPILKGEKLNAVKRPLGAYDIFIRFNQSVSILEKVIEKKEPSISKHVSSRKPFGFPTNFKDYKDEKFPNSIEIIGNNDNGWVDESKITVNRQWIGKFKVVISKAYNGGDNYPHQIINKPIIMNPESCCTETYLVFRVLDDKDQAVNLERYMKTKFFRFMVWLRKISQDNPKDRFLFVPDLSLQSIWTDQDLYAKYNLTKDEIDFIETMIKEIP